MQVLKIYMLTLFHKVRADLAIISMIGRLYMKKSERLPICNEQHFTLYARHVRVAQSHKAK